jgi:hypothetical protein
MLDNAVVVEHDASVAQLMLESSRAEATMFAAIRPRVGKEGSFIWAIVFIERRFSGRLSVHYRAGRTIQVGL